MGSKLSKELKSKARVNKNKNELESIIYKHQILPDRFIRMEMLYYLPNKIMPIDIISLCYKFYHIDLKHLLLTNNPKITRAIRDFWSSADYYMCYELAKLLTNHEYSRLKLQMNCKVAHILLLWQQFEEAEVSFKVALNAMKGIRKQDRNKFHVSEPRERSHYGYGMLLKKQQQYDLAVDQFQLAFNVNKDNVYYIF